MDVVDARGDVVVDSGELGFDEGRVFRDVVVDIFDVFGVDDLGSDHRFYKVREIVNLGDRESFSISRVPLFVRDDVEGLPHVA